MLNDTRKHQAAKRCINRIGAMNYVVNEPHAGRSTRLLMAYVWCAMHDAAVLTIEYSAAMALFIDGLYEMQRGYSLSNQKIDIGGADRPICTALAIHSLIAKLAGIHPDGVSSVLPIHDSDYYRLQVNRLKLNALPCEASEQYALSFGNHLTQNTVANDSRILNKPGL